MFNRKNIEHIIARVVTQSALTLPVAYIQSIVFFNGKTKIADCSWEHFQQNGRHPKRKEFHIYHRFSLCLWCFALSTCCWYGWNGSRIYHCIWQFIWVKQFFSYLVDKGVRRGAWFLFFMPFFVQNCRNR